MKLTFLGPGVFITREDGRFGCVGPGDLIEVDAERGQMLLAAGTASKALREQDELERVPAEELKGTADGYNAVHAKIVEATAEMQARMAVVKAAGGKT